MNSSRLFVRLFLVTLALVVGGTAARGAEQRKQALGRMEQRLAAVDGLKEQKLVGENNRGYLEARASLNGEQQAVVSDENADRRTVYEAIAKEQGVSVEQVGRGRAAKIAVASKRGVWLQGNDGVWHQKP